MNWHDVVTFIELGTGLFYSRQCNRDTDGRGMSMDSVLRLEKMGYVEFNMTIVEYTLTEKGKAAFDGVKFPVNFEVRIEEPQKKVSQKRVDELVTYELSCVSEREKRQGPSYIANLIAARVTRGWAFRKTSVKEHLEECNRIVAEVFRQLGEKC